MRKLSQFEITNAIIGKAAGCDIVRVEDFACPAAMREFRTLAEAVEYMGKLGCYSLSSGHEYTDGRARCVCYTVCANPVAEEMDAVTMWDEWAELQTAIAGGDALDIVGALRGLEFAVECTGDGTDLSGAFAQLEGRRR